MQLLNHLLVLISQEPGTNLISVLTSHPYPDSNKSPLNRDKAALESKKPQRGSGSGDREKNNKMQQTKR